MDWRGLDGNIPGGCRKMLRYLLACKLGEMVTLFAGARMGFPHILLLRQLLLVTVVASGLPALALGLSPAGKGHFGGRGIYWVLMRGVLMGMTSPAVFILIYNATQNTLSARTATLLTLVLSQLVYAIEGEGVGKYPTGGFPRLRLWGGVACALGVTVGVIYLPSLQRIFGTVSLTGGELALILTLCAIAPLATALIAEASWNKG